MTTEARITHLTETHQLCDPDALVQNLIVGLFGYHTEDGK